MQSRLIGGTTAVGKHKETTAARYLVELSRHCSTHPYHDGRNKFNIYKRNSDGEKLFLLISSVHERRKSHRPTQYT